MRRAAAVLAILLVAGWLLTSPGRGLTELPPHTVDIANGEQVFWAGGCASCHASEVDGRRARGDDKLLLGGGLELETVYGVFRVPNISPHEQAGIGGWTNLQFANAMQHGVSPDGRH